MEQKQEDSNFVRKASMRKRKALALKEETTKVEGEKKIKKEKASRHKPTKKKKQHSKDQQQNKDEKHQEKKKRKERVKVTKGGRNVVKQQPQQQPPPSMQIASPLPTPALQLPGNLFYSDPGPLTLPYGGLAFNPFDTSSSSSTTRTQETVPITANPFSLLIAPPSLPSTPLIEDSSTLNACTAIIPSSSLPEVGISNISSSTSLEAEVVSPPIEPPLSNAESTTSSVADEVYICRGSFSPPYLTSPAYGCWMPIQYYHSLLGYLQGIASQLDSLEYV